MPDPAVKIEIRHLTVHRDSPRGRRRVLAVDHLAIPAGQVTALIGPNGAGKSTLLAVLQLLLTPDSGDLFLDGAPMRDNVLATRRRLAAAFQDPLLLSGSVLHNVEMGQGFRRVPRAGRRRRALHWLARFGVDHLARHNARALSGGEAQRVALARAFALEPDVLLLDEPFAALDAPTRAALIEDFAAIVRDARLTTVLVTHDRDEALRLADRVVVLIDGAIRQAGPPQEVFAAPADEEVAAFVGVENVWPATLVTAADGVATYALAPHGPGALRLDVAAADPPRDGLVCIRPEEITLRRPDDAPAASARNRLTAVVRSLRPAGPGVRVTLEITAAAAPLPLTLVATVTRPSVDALALAPGLPLLAEFKATAAHCIPRGRPASERPASPAPPG